MLDRSLNVAVNQIASRIFPLGFDIAADAPSTFEELCSRMDTGNRMTVWDGASDATIFGCAETNYAFRAWHDFHHWQARQPFTPQGEHAVALLQCADLRTVYGDTPQVAAWARVIMAEVDGQLEYAEAHGGEFPNDQAGFIAAYLVDKADACARTF